MTSIFSDILTFRLVTSEKRGRLRLLFQYYDYMHFDLFYLNFMSHNDHLSAGIEVF